MTHFVAYGPLPETLDDSNELVSIAHFMCFLFYRDHQVIWAPWDLQEPQACPDLQLHLVVCLLVHLSASILVSRLVPHNVATAERRDLTSWNRNNKSGNDSSYFYTSGSTSDSSFYHTAERIIISDSP